jgi:hypothetical protein
MQPRLRVRLAQAQRKRAKPVDFGGVRDVCVRHLCGFFLIQIKRVLNQNASFVDEVRISAR